MVLHAQGLLGLPHWARERTTMRRGTPASGWHGSLAGDALRRDARSGTAPEPFGPMTQVKSLNGPIVSVPP